MLFAGAARYAAIFRAALARVSTAPLRRMRGAPSTMLCAMAVPPAVRQRAQRECCRRQPPPLPAEIDPSPVSDA